ncbi:manganese peroxidase [Gloeopeniophorella convolvens]|nr:manganese peroxidase [Gloeopeniophorella convolvens]
MLFKAAVFLSAFAGVVNATITRRALCPDGVHTANNAACCDLFIVIELLQAELFDGQCDELAHEAVRLAFHDAIGFSNSVPNDSGGGADGSIVTFADVELTYHANIGLDYIVNEYNDILATLSELFEVTISAGDLVQLAAAVGLSTCPGAPRLAFFVGRPAAAAAAPDLTVPEPFDTVDSILARFAEAGFSTQQVVSLLAAHSIADASHIDPTIPGTPLDSTPFIFDTQIFVETLLRGTMFPGDGPNQGEVQAPVPGEMRLQSDQDLARDERTACIWQGMVNNQQLMESRFQSAMKTLSLLGQNTASLTDCSDVVPVPLAVPPANAESFFPAGQTQDDVEQSCAAAPFPELPTQTGPTTTILPVPQYTDYS